MHKMRVLSLDIFYLDNYPIWVYIGDVLKMSNKWSEVIE